MFIHSGLYLDYALVFMRIMVGLVFAASGLADLRNPVERSKGIGMPKGFTFFLGVAEVLGGAAVISGILTQLASIGLIRDSPDDSGENHISARQRQRSPGAVT